MEIQTTEKNPPLEHWFECPSCHYQWPPIVTVPVACPSCKRRFRANMLPIEILHPPQSRKKVKLPGVEVLSRTDMRSSYCEICAELNPGGSVHAEYIAVGSGKKVCEKHLKEASR